MVNFNHWNEYHKRWQQLRPPLRPNADVVRALQAAVAPAKGRTLLLGITPELAVAFSPLVAIEKNQAMIDHVWPGATPERIAIQGDWLDMSSELGNFSVVVGDGSLNVLPDLSSIQVVLQRVSDRLVDGGTFAARVYLRPDRTITREALIEHASRPATINFHAFKWLVAMSIAGRHGSTVPVVAILDEIMSLAPDLGRLASVTGWPREDVETLAVYRGSAAAYCFPSHEEILSAFPGKMGKPVLHSSGHYDISELCPIVVARKAAAPDVARGKRSLDR